MFYHFDPNHDVDEQTLEPAQNHMVQVKLRFNTELAARGFLTHPGSVCIAWDVKSMIVMVSSLFDSVPILYKQI